MTDAKALAADARRISETMAVEARIARDTNADAQVCEDACAERSQLLFELAEEVDSLRARLARVEEALRPLAELHVSQVAHDQIVFTTIPEGASDWTKNKSIRYSDIIRARDALSAALSEVKP